ncbi:unnamed protein product, partial [Dibothriocephalus latus]
MEVYMVDLFPIKIVMERQIIIIPVHFGPGVNVMLNKWKGWIKWNSQGHLDHHAKSAAANYPDWYARRMADIRAADLKFTLRWAYDRWGKPNSFNALGFVGPEAAAETKDSPFFMRDCGTRKPQKVAADIPTVRYGQLHPPHYEQPVRSELFPPL